MQPIEITSDEEEEAGPSGQEDAQQGVGTAFGGRRRSTRSNRHRGTNERFAVQSPDQIDALRVRHVQGTESAKQHSAPSSTSLRRAQMLRHCHLGV